MCHDTAPCSGRKLTQLCLEMTVVIPVVQVVVAVVPLVHTDGVVVLASIALVAQVPIGIPWQRRHRS